MTKKAYDGTNCPMCKEPIPYEIDNWFDTNCAVELLRCSNPDCNIEYTQTYTLTYATIESTGKKVLPKKLK